MRSVDVNDVNEMIPDSPSTKGVGDDRLVWEAPVLTEVDYEQTAGEISGDPGPEFVFYS